MDPSTKASFGANPIPNHFPMTFPEIVYLKFVERPINQAISNKIGTIFLGASEKMQQDFQKYCEACGYSKILPELKLQIIIKSLWEKIQEVQYSKETQDSTIQLNNEIPNSGYFFTLAQAESLMNGMNSAEKLLLDTYANSK